MIYQFFLFRDDEKLFKWEKGGFPTHMDMQVPEVIKEDKIIQLTAEKSFLSFETKNFEDVAVSFLPKGELTYIITSDVKDTLSARKRFLRLTANKVGTKLDEMKEKGDFSDIEKIVKKNIKSTSKFLSLARSSAFGSSLLGILGAGIATFVATYIGSMTGIFLLPMGGRWLPFLSLFFFVLLIGGIAGILAGRGVGGFIGSYLFLVFLFFLPLSENFISFSFLQTLKNLFPVTT